MLRREVSAAAAERHIARFAQMGALFDARLEGNVYDLLLGLNRWVLRVAAYVALMTDQYPPFRLDQGGDDPRSARLTVPPPSRQP